MRVAVAAMLLALSGSSALARVKDGRGLTSAAASTAASDTATPASTLSANASLDSLVATAMPDAPPLPAEVRIAEPLSIAPVTPDPALANTFLTNKGLESIHALMSPPSAVVKLKTQPHTHSFFDARNTFGLASLGVSLTADALSTQKGL
ncbi:MAG TPA: hypothetical protein VGP65_09725, partial [Candidatus Angelobacter sp.]|nr:hypothetical protein [Candidatus Angelobacter sp.]